MRIEIKKMQCIQILMFLYYIVRDISNHKNMRRNVFLHRKPTDNVQDSNHNFSKFYSSKDSHQSSMPSLIKINKSSSHNNFEKKDSQLKQVSVKGERNEIKLKKTQEYRKTVHKLRNQMEEEQSKSAEHCKRVGQEVIFRKTNEKKDNDCGPIYKMKARRNNSQLINHQISKRERRASFIDYNNYVLESLNCRQKTYERQSIEQLSQKKGPLIFKSKKHKKEINSFINSTQRQKNTFDNNQSLDSIEWIEQGKNDTLNKLASDIEYLKNYRLRTMSNQNDQDYERQLRKVCSHQIFNEQCSQKYGFLIPLLPINNDCGSHRAYQYSQLRDKHHQQLLRQYKRKVKKRIENSQNGGDKDRYCWNCGCIQQSNSIGEIDIDQQIQKIEDQLNNRSQELRLGCLAISRKLLDLTQDLKIIQTSIKQMMQYAMQTIKHEINQFVSSHLNHHKIRQRSSSAKFEPHPDCQDLTKLPLYCSQMLKKGNKEGYYDANSIKTVELKDICNNSKHKYIKTFTKRSNGCNEQGIKNDSDIKNNSDIKNEKMKQISVRQERRKKIKNEIILRNKRIEKKNTLTTSTDIQKNEKKKQENCRFRYSHGPFITTDSQQITNKRHQIQNQRLWIHQNILNKKKTLDKNKSATMVGKIIRQTNTIKQLQYSGKITSRHSRLQTTPIEQIQQPSQLSFYNQTFYTPYTDRVFTHKYSPTQSKKAKKQLNNSLSIISSRLKQMKEIVGI